jgi:predicted RNA binding protein YcfA (HicA-like mRNA interferase family)
MIRILERNGWRRVRTGKHAIYQKEGVPGSIPVPVHGNKPLKPKTQKSILRSAGLTAADL